MVPVHVSLGNRNGNSPVTYGSEKLRFNFQKMGDYSSVPTSISCKADGLDLGALVGFEHLAKVTSV